MAQDLNLNQRLIVNDTDGVRVTGITSGSYLEISGNLPGYTAGLYPTIKSGGTIHFAVNGAYSAYLEANDTYFGILDSNTVTRVLLRTNGASYFTGGNVGIGTTSPEGGLHVASSSSGGIGGQIVIDNPAGSTLGNTAEISFLTDAGASGTGTRNARILAVNENAGNGAANMQFHTWNGAASAERMRITSGGNVGIGTTSPSYKLHVQGTSYFFDQSIFDDKVGIGTTSPNVRLHIKDSSSGTKLRIETTGTTGEGYSELGFTAGSSVGYIWLANNSATAWGGAGSLNIYTQGAMTFYAGGTEKMRISSAGNVGIGTDSPSYKFTVNESTTNPIAYFGLGPANASSRNSLVILQSGTIPQSGSDTTGEAGFLFKHSYGTGGVNGTANGGYIESIRESVFGITSQVNTALVFGTSASNTDNERMRITSGGNVGIGTTSPGAKLEVNGTGVAAAATLKINTSSSSTFVHSQENMAANLTSGQHNILVIGQRTNTKNSGYIGYYWAGDASNSNFVTIGHWGVDDIFRVYGNSTVTMSGNVGIGTTSPAYTLDVNGSAGIYGDLNFTKADGVGINAKESLIITIDSDNNDTGRVFQIKEGSGNTLMVVQEAGNVGIGTTSPESYYSHKLVVNAGNEDGITIVGGTSDINYLMFADGTAGNARYRGMVWYNHSIDMMGFSTSGSNRMYIDATGNVGIGTTSPSDILHVYKSGANTRLIVGNNAAYDQFIYFQGNTDWSMGIDYSNSNAFTLGNYSSIGTSVRLTVTTGGNVGIGTDSPQATLHVNGVMRWGGGTSAPYTYSGIDSGGVYIEQVDNNTGKDKIRFQTRTNDTGSYTQFVIDANAQNFTFNRGDITLADGYRIWLRGSSSSSTTGSKSYVHSDGLNLKIKGDDNVQLLGDGETVLLHADYTGNIGIGTTNPTYKLHVTGSGYFENQLTVSDSLTAEALFQRNSNYSNVRITGLTASGTQERRWTIARLYFTPNHWGAHNMIKIRLVSEYYNAGYVEYNLHTYYGMGNGSSASYYVTDKGGYLGDGGADGMKISLGTVTLAGWTSGSQNTYYQDVYVDVNDYMNATAHIECLGIDYATSNPTSSADGYNVFVVYTSPSAVNFTWDDFDHSSSYFGSAKIWNSSNDGASSGLDADLLDGNHASAFALASHTHSEYYPTTGGTLTGDLSITKDSPWISINKQGTAVTTQEGGIRWQYKGNNIFYFYSDNGDDGNLRIQAPGLTGESDATPRLIIPRSNKDLYLAVSGGNVGIGTTAPDEKLHVVTSNSSQDTYVPGLKLHNEGNSANTGYGTGIEFQLSTDYQDYKKAEIRAVATSGYGNRISLGFWTGGSTAAYHAERIRIDGDTGYVGIGTTSPNSQLQVGNPNASGSGITIAAQYNLSNAYLRFRSGHPDNSNIWETANISATDDGNYNGRIHFRTSTSGQSEPSIKMTIKADGKVGIGTTAPEQPLHVAGRVQADYLKIGGDTSSGANNIYDSYVDASSAYYHTPKAIIRYDSSAAGGIDEAPIGLLIFNRDGGNDTWTKLSLGSREASGSGNTVSVAGIAAQKTSGTANNWASGDLHLWTKDGATPVTNMVLKSSGYVGIGTTSPSAKFHVVGVQQTASAKSPGAIIQQQYYDPGSGGQLISSALTLRTTSSGGDNWASGAIVGLVGNPGDTGSYPGGLAFYTKPKGTVSTDVVEAMRIAYNSNVGIGVTSPSYKLEVSGTSYFSGLAHFGQTATSGSAFRWGPYGTAVSADTMLCMNQLWNGSGWSIISSSVGTSYINLGSSVATPDISFGTGGANTSATTRVIIKNDGNVGIGTTSPSYKLDVSGGAIAIRGNAAGNSLRFDDSAGTSRNAFYVDTSNYLNIGNANYAGVKFVQTASSPTSGEFAGNQIQNAIGSTSNGVVLAEPSAWLAVRVGTTDYAIPMYTTG